MRQCVENIQDIFCASSSSNSSSSPDTLAHKRLGIWKFHQNLTRKVSPDFIIVPNWSTFLASRHTLWMHFHHPYIWQHFDAARLHQSAMCQIEHVIVQVDREQY